MHFGDRSNECRQARVIDRPFSPTPEVLIFSRALLAIGAALMLLAGLAIIRVSTPGAPSSWMRIVPRYRKAQRVPRSIVVAGVGHGISFALVADTAVAAVPANRAGSAGAIAETSNEIGNALGIALLGSTAALIFRLAGRHLAPTLDETLDLNIPFTVIEQAKSAFLNGLHVAVSIAAVLSAALGLLALRWIPKTRKAAESRGG